MKKIMMSISVALLLSGASAAAQTGGGSSSFTKNSSASERPSSQAPVGHRQPRRGDVPDEKNLDETGVSKEEAALDRKIKGICRGC